MAHETDSTKVELEEQVGEVVKRTRVVTTANRVVIEPGTKDGSVQVRLYYDE